MNVFTSYVLLTITLVGSATNHNAYRTTGNEMNRNVCAIANSLSYMYICMYTCDITKRRVDIVHVLKKIRERTTCQFCALWCVTSSSSYGQMYLFC